MVYDVAIVGTGPAGVSAALNMKIHEKNFVWLGSKRLSDKIAKAEQINNYPGMYAVTGEEMMEAFRNQVEKMEIPIEEHMVNNIMKFGDHFALMAGSEFYEAKAVILTTGIAVRTTLENEANFLGRGLSYCATCDGALYRDKIIAVVCNNARFEHEVEYLGKLAKLVYYFPQYSPVGPLPDNVIIPEAKIAGVDGDKRVERIKLASGDSVFVDGAFVLRDSISLDALVKDLEVENNHIMVNRQMETSIEGIFAAGDCTGRPYQYTKAVGEGNVAAHSVLEYLASIDK